MHRSRPPVFAIFAAIAACSTRHDPDANEILSQDSTLVATLEVRQKPQSLPDACGTMTVPARPAAANRELANELARQAYDAELLGNTRQAKALLLRASTLDGTDKSAAYHLGRTSEVLGDRPGAVTAYCRYLTLAPTAAEQAEARQRVGQLFQEGPQPPGPGSVSYAIPATRRIVVATTRPETRERPAAERRAATRAVVQRAPRHGSAAEAIHPSGTVIASADDSAPRSDGVGTVQDDAGRAERGPDGVDGMRTAEQASPVEQPSTVSRPTSRGPTAAQSIGLGAVAGAIIGAATGRSVKSAIIGAAGGGVLGTVVGGMTRPTGRTLRPWATNAPRPTGYPSARLPYRYRPAA